MKLVIAVVQDKDGGRLQDALVKNGFRATKLASTGGFLKAGNTTFLIGVEEEKVDDLLDVIKKNCQSRDQTVAPLSAAGSMGTPVETYVPYPVTVKVGGATVFVVDVEKFAHF